MKRSVFHFIWLLHISADRSQPNSLKLRAIN